MMQTQKAKVLKRIEQMPPGSVFSAKDVLDIASRSSVDVLLAALAKAGTIRRISRGLYDLPKFNPDLGGCLNPDVDAAARAIARRRRWKIVPEGAWAANQLGLSEQVPSKIVYLTDGPSHKEQVGWREIFFKHARPAKLTGSDEKFSLVVQALRHLGKEHVGPLEISKLRKVLSEAEKKKLLKDTRFGSDWIYSVARSLVEDRA
jgi:hypothetical protein